MFGVCYAKHGSQLETPKSSVSKNPLIEETKILQDIIINSIITNLKFQHNLAKISSFKKPHINKKIDLLLLPSRGQNPLKLLYSRMNLNTTILLP